jgi:hypothetical protein
MSVNFTVLLFPASLVVTVLLPAGGNKNKAIHLVNTHLLRIHCLTSIVLGIGDIV